MSTQIGKALNKSSKVWKSFSSPFSCSFSKQWAFAQERRARLPRREHRDLRVMHLPFCNVRRRGQRFGCFASPYSSACHFPIQNSLKILPSRSSVSIFPTTSPIASSAARNSIEMNSGDLRSTRLWRPVSSNRLAFWRAA
jgi:hypothetical protein